jgi:hypothetical protein
MALNPLPAAGPPGWVVSAFSLAVQAEDSSSVESAQIRAANRAGYTRAAGYSTAQQIAVGQGLRSAETFALGQGGGPGADRTGPARAGPPAVIPAPPPTFYPPVISPGPPYQPPPPGSGGSGSSGIPPRPPSGGGTPGINPNAPAVGGPSLWPLVIGQVVGPTVLDTILRANDYAMAAWNVILGGPRPIPKGPTTRPPVGRQPDRGNPWPPAGAPPQVTVNMPAPREPYSERVARVLGDLGGDIYVSTARLPVPSAPPPTPAKVPLWLTLLPIFGPSLLGFLQPNATRTTVRLTDPLTRPGTGGNPFPSTGPLTGSNPLVQSYGAFGGSGAVGTNTCECKAPRKKRRKKKRTVCYSGTFIERRDGTRKTKKRKVQCL